MHLECMALEAAAPLRLPYLVARHVRETWSRHGQREIQNELLEVLGGQKDTTVKPTIELCTPLWNNGREISVVWGDVDKKV
jgi:hypothetical protein